MVDVSTTIQPKSDQLNADDLIGGPITIKITGVAKSGTQDQPIAINYDGDCGKPYKPCKSMRRVLVQIWGKDGQSYVGKSMTLYCDPKVKFGGMDVGGIRISHMSDIKEKITLALTASRANKKPFVVQPLIVSENNADPKIKEAGLNAANGGVKAYKDWLDSLAPEDKEPIRKYHNEWSKIATTKQKEIDSHGEDSSILFAG